MQCLRKLLIFLIFISSITFVSATDLSYVDTGNSLLFDRGDGSYITLTGQQNFSEFNFTSPTLNITTNGSYSTYNSTANTTLSSISYLNDILNFTGSATSGTLNISRQTTHYNLSYGLYVDSTLHNLTTSLSGQLFFNYSGWSTHTFLIQRPAPYLISPANQSTQYYNYPPQSNTINFTWETFSFFGSTAYQIQVAKDINFNLISVDKVVSNNYSAEPLQGTQNYWWKVRTYNSATGAYGAWSGEFQFTLQMNTTATGTGIQGTIYEIVSSTTIPISGASVFIYNTTWSSTQVTGSNGYYFFNTGNGTYYLKAAKTNYEDSELQTVNVTYNNISTQDILLEKCISGFNCFYNQKYVKFIVQNPIGTKYSGVAVSIYKGSDVTTTYTGTTDDQGSWTELFFIGQKYRITFVKASQSINEEITVTIAPNGQDDSYTVLVWGSPITTRTDNISWNLYSADNNATTTFLNLTYNSNTTTTSLNFWVKNATGALLYSTNTASVTAWTASFAVIDTNNLAYVWGFNASHPTWGDISQSGSIRFKSQFLIDLNIDDTRIYTWISIGFLTILSLLFSKSTNKYGYVLVPLFALFTWGVGWFPQGYQTSHFTLIMTTLVIGVIAYMRASEKKAVYPY